MRDCLQYSFEGLSETSNDQGWGGGTLYPKEDCPPPPTTTDYVHRGLTGEIVSSILLKGIQKLQMTRLFSIPFDHYIKLKAYMRVGGGGAFNPGVDCAPPPPPPPPHPRSLTVYRDEI